MALRLTFLTALAAFAAGCSNSGNNNAASTVPAGTKPKIGVVTNTTDPFWDLCEAGANKAAKDFDVDLVFRQPEKLDAAIQMPIIDAWVKQGMNGIAVSVIDPKGQEEDLTRIAKKVSLVTMDNDAAESTGRLCYIGVDNHEAGRAAGRMVKKALPNGGTIALFIGNNSSANAVGRISGVLDELGTPEANGTPGKHPTKPEVNGKFYGKYFLVDGEAKTDGGPGEKAVTNTRDVLGRLEGVTDICMVGLYAYNPPAILEAARAKSLVGKIKIVGFDENLETLKAIDKGEIEGTVWQDPFNYGYKSVEVLAAAARGDKSKIVGKGQIPYRLVTKDGGPDQTTNGLVIQNLKAAVVEKKIRDDLASVKK
ncbi:substrate-binding domain-containing protein [Limnoglobus roseus]|uniref:Ribose transporter, periplasmic binding protein n=1 Tax=Limnoglobus roseus TaxID=2598579 RepID=A0A5C1AHZ4_9BACT|nr:substrate-binding domain-containing protein [Limnoglobus roseus]QEL17282.1 Ribose transporter, periplasmic binding protein [Limnoglobus roseus]